MAAPSERRLPPSSEKELRRLKPILRLLSRLNVGVYRLTHGRVGGRFLRGAPVCLVTTVGRRSGTRRTVPLIYLEDGERVVLVASQGGMPRHPLWYRNLETHPEAEVQIGRRRRRLRARTASPEEKAALWPRLCAVYPDYDDYKQRTDREIPVVILEPAHA